jgi:hypothetical protein
MQSEDVTGGPIDELLTRLESAFPDGVIERLHPTHAADDNNLWFVRSSTESTIEVQFGCHPGRHPPFTLEGIGQRFEGSSPGTSFTVLAGWLAPDA